FFFFQAEDGIRDFHVTGVQTCALPISGSGDTHYAVRLNGSENERIGLARSLAVMTGDTVRAEVFAKYLDPDQNNWTAALHDLMRSEERRVGKESRCRRWA